MRLALSSFTIGFAAIGVAGFSTLLALILVFPHAGALAFVILGVLPPLALALHALLSLRRETLSAIDVCRAGMAGRLSRRPVPAAETEFRQLAEGLDELVESMLRASSEYRPLLDEAIRICRAAAAGHVGARLSGLDRSARIGEFTRALNRLLDVSETFVRDISGNVRAAAQGNAYRKIPLTAYSGAHRDVVELVNSVLEQISERCRGDADIAHALSRKLPEMIHRLAEAASALGVAAGRNLPQIEPFLITAGAPSPLAAADPQLALRHFALLEDAAEALHARALHIRTCKSDWNREIDKILKSAERTRDTVHRLNEMVRGFDTVAVALKQASERVAMVALDTAIASSRAGSARFPIAAQRAELEAISLSLSDLSDALCERITGAAAILGAAIENLPPDRRAGDSVRRLPASRGSVSVPRAA